MRHDLLWDFIILFYQSHSDGNPTVLIQLHMYIHDFMYSDGFVSAIYIDNAVYFVFSAVD